MYMQLTKFLINNIRPILFCYVLFCFVIECLATTFLHKTGQTESMRMIDDYESPEGTDLIETITSN